MEIAASVEGDSKLRMRCQVSTASSKPKWTLNVLKTVFGDYGFVAQKRRDEVE